MNISLHSNINFAGNTLMMMSTFKPIIKCPKISCTTTRDHLEMHGNKKKANGTYYDLLSLGSRDVGLEEIKKAYRTMALRYHPDVACPSNNDSSAKDESTRRFIELRRAYETLSDPDSRELYDYELTLTDGQSQSYLGRAGLGLGVEGMVLRNNTTRRSPSVLSKEVWENQLRGLRRRSQVRMKRRNCQ